MSPLALILVATVFLVRLINALYRARVDGRIAARRGHDTGAR